MSQNVSFARSENRELFDRKVESFPSSWLLNLWNALCNFIAYPWPSVFDFFCEKCVGHVRFDISACFLAFIYLYIPMRFAKKKT